MTITHWINLILWLDITDYLTQLIGNSSIFPVGLETVMVPPEGGAVCLAHPLTDPPQLGLFPTRLCWDQDVRGGLVSLQRCRGAAG